MEKHRKQTSPAQAGLEPTGGGGCQNQTTRVRKKATVPRGPPTKCESNDGERRKRKNGHGGFQRGGGGTERFVVFGKNEVGIVSGFVRQSRKVRRRKEEEKERRRKEEEEKKMKKEERRKKKEERRKKKEEKRKKKEERRKKKEERRKKKEERRKEDDDPVLRMLVFSLSLR